MNVQHRAAHGFAAKGIPVFPCRPGAKEPLTPRGFHNASTDHGQIDSWWRTWAGANLGMPTGHRSGLLVIDLDRKDGRDGVATLHALERDLGELPVTLTAVTPSGGEHRFFRMPGRVVRNSAGKVCGAPAPGFDVRGDGGYVLLYPSVVAGKPYTWQTRMKPAELPEVWVSVLARDVEPNEPKPEPWTPRDEKERSRAAAWCVRALQQEARALAAAPKGTRNDALWRAAAALGGLVHTGTITEEDVRKALTWACSTWGTRTPRKDAVTLENGLRFGIAHPRAVEIGGDRAA